MTADFKRRLSIFGTGLVIGTIASVILFQFWDSGEPADTAKKVDVVLSTCDIASGEVFEKECAEIRKDVAVHFVPPDILYAKELDWHIGKTLRVDVAKGDAIRTVDFEP